MAVGTEVSCHDLRAYTLGKAVVLVRTVVRLSRANAVFSCAICCPFLVSDETADDIARIMVIHVSYFLRDNEILQVLIAV